SNSNANRWTGDQSWRADSTRCNSSRGQPRSESAATRPQLCDTPQPLGEQCSHRYDFLKETQKASCPPGLLRDKHPGSNLPHKLPVPSDRAGETDWKIRV